MSYNEIINIVSDKQSNPDKLFIALFIIRIHIEYCVKNNINMYDDPLLSKILLFR